MHVRLTVAAACVALLPLAGCAGDPVTGTGPRENTGTLLGAVTGAAIGSQFGGSPGSRIAAGVAGAAIGGMIGNRIGAALDDEDRRLAYEAQVAALEEGPSGAPRTWRNPTRGPRCCGRPPPRAGLHRNSVVPGWRAR